MMPRKLLNTILAHFKEIQQVSLATIEGDSPRVRPVMLLRINNRFFFATFHSDAKMGQIKANPRIEFCLMLKGNYASGYVRGKGKASLCDEISLKEKVLKMIPVFSKYFPDSGDKNFALVELLIDTYEYMPIGSDKAERIKLV